MAIRKMKTDPLLAQLTKELIEIHKCHTVMLYGSRARGDDTERSDYDIAGVRKSGKQFRLSEKREGHYVDIVIYPEADLKRVTQDLLYMKGARVLFEKSDFGKKFVGSLAAAIKKKYVPLPADEIRVRQVWLHKMLERAAQNDIEGNYRRVWLLEALLTEYFHIRKKPYWGSKVSFAWLSRHDPETYALLSKVLSSPNAKGPLKKLVERVSKIKSPEVLR